MHSQSNERWVLGKDAGARRKDLSQHKGENKDGVESSSHVIMSQSTSTKRTPLADVTNELERHQMQTTVRSSSRKLHCNDVIISAEL
ncbi:unnamed protein product [Cuscuta campestris]|uniref:Uncharacterized protein n=1 Tax=Cuscuta campestris TaxID=132261 RepID=A0A484KES4_9ASTE|nr:unnamed protein product [Cuscuta campestris]